VLDYIDANLSQQLLMDELASVACLSPSHFARVFRETFGRTAHRYVTERRIERAKHALSATRDPVTLIAFDCGFGSSAHFATVFRQNVGVAPSAYRAATLEPTRGGRLQ
jgi:AraC family transcriptional regulator